MKASAILVLLVLSLTLFSLPVTPETAREAAENFLSYKQTRSAIDTVVPVERSGKTLLYVYQLDEPGFVAVAGDDNVAPVLAYSFRNHLTPDPDNLIFTMMQQDVRNRLAWVAENPAHGEQSRQKWNELLAGMRPQRDFQQWPAEGSTLTDGWLETTWNQSGIFNDFCPLDNSGERSVVGCVATAMSMILHFHRHVGGVSFSQADSYVSGWSYPYMYIDGDHDERDFPSFTELNGYLDVLDDHYQNGVTPTSDDLAALCFAAGISVEMSYSSGGSGAYTSDVPWVLNNKFGYSGSWWMDWNNGSFLDDVASEMIHMRPTEFSIRLPDGSGGHAINCDGYNTDDFYHLNFGWGTSNNTCWYTLPEGMPNNYSIIGGSTMNVEGGVVPVAVDGTVNISGLSPVGAYVRLEGYYNYEYYVTSPSGAIDIPAVFPGTYVASVTIDDRLWFEEYEIEINAASHTLTFNPASYDGLTGVVDAPVTLSGTGVHLYGEDEDGEVVRLSSVSADEDGLFVFPDVLPGDYMVYAEADDGYYGITDYTVTATDQHVDFSISQHTGTPLLGWGGPPVEVFSIGTAFDMAVGVRIPAEESELLAGRSITAIRFKSPFDPEDGEVRLQVWENRRLMTEQPVELAPTGQWLQPELDQYVLIRPGYDYYIGYWVSSSDGRLVWRDNGPRAEGRGAYFKTSAWMPLTSNRDYNFCIEPVIRTAGYGTVSGSVQLDGGNGVMQDVRIGTDQWAAHPDESGFWTLHIPAGQHVLTARLHNYDTETTEPLNVTLDGTYSDVDFHLTYNPTDAGDTDAPQHQTALLGNSPNPFNPETTIRFSLAADSPVRLDIFNIRGQRVETLVNDRLKAGSHELVWDAVEMPSGMYLYRLSTDEKTFTRRMVLMK